MDKMESINMRLANDIPMAEKRVIGTLNIVCNRDLKSTSFPITTGLNLVGNLESNHIVLSIESVSAVHCVFEVSDEIVWIEDLASTNGTCVGSHILLPNKLYQIRDGQSLTIGPVEATIELTRLPEPRVAMARESRLENTHSLAPESSHLENEPLGPESHLENTQTLAQESHLEITQDLFVDAPGSSGLKMSEEFVIPDTQAEVAEKNDQDILDLKNADETDSDLDEPSHVQINLDHEIDSQQPDEEPLKEDDNQHPLKEDDNQQPVNEDHDMDQINDQKDVNATMDLDLDLDMDMFAPQDSMEDIESSAKEMKEMEPKTSVKRSPLVVESDQSAKKPKLDSLAIPDSQASLPSTRVEESPLIIQDNVDDETIPLSNDEPIENAEDTPFNEPVAQETPLREPTVEITPVISQGVMMEEEMEDDHLSLDSLPVAKLATELEPAVKKPIVYKSHKMPTLLKNRSRLLEEEEEDSLPPLNNVLLERQSLAPQVKESIQEPINEMTPPKVAMKQGQMEEYQPSPPSETLDKKPEKSRRGRQAKALEELGDVETALEPKRTRKPTKELIESVSAQVTINEPKKRGRAASKSVPLEPVLEEETIPAPVEAKLKKGRGKAKEVAEPEPIVEELEEIAPTPPVVPLVKPKKGRGKAKEVAEPEPIEDQDTEEVAPPEVPLVKPKKGRGKAKEVAEPEPIVEDQEMEELAPTPPEVPLVKPKNGRGKAKEVAEAGPIVEDQEMEGAAPPVVPLVKPKKGRGKAKEVAELEEHPLEDLKTKGRGKKANDEDQDHVVEPNSQGQEPTSRRKGQRKSLEAQENDESKSNSQAKDSNYRILFTGQPDWETTLRSDQVTEMGGTVVQDWQSCTHLVTDRVKRTVKFLCALSTGKFIMDIKWLEGCKREGRFVPETKYLLKDPKAEKEYGFKLKSASHSLDHPLFEGFTFYATPTIKLPFNDLSEILKAVGGTLLRDLEESPPSEKLIVLGAPDDTSVCKKLMDQGYQVHSVEFVLTGILRAQVDFSSHKLNSAPPKGKKR